MNVGVVLRSRAWNLPMVSQVCKDGALAELTYVELERLVEELVRLRMMMKEEEFYGTMPEELPDSLPIGTRGAGCEALQALHLHALTKDTRYPVYVGAVRAADGRTFAGILAENVDWATVVRQTARDRARP